MLATSDTKIGQSFYITRSYLEDDRFFFPTFELTYIESKASYPKEPYVSFLDHIMLTNSFLNLLLLGSNPYFLINSL